MKFMVLYQFIFRRVLKIAEIHFASGSRLLKCLEILDHFFCVWTAVMGLETYARKCSGTTWPCICSHSVVVWYILLYFSCIHFCIILIQHDSCRYPQLVISGSLLPCWTNLFTLRQLLHQEPFAFTKRWFFLSIFFFFVFFSFYLWICNWMTDIKFSFVSSLFY